MADSGKTDDQIPHVLVLGGGFAAILLYKKLAGAIRRHQLRLTIIDRDNFNCFHGLVPEVLTGKIQPGNILNSLRTIFRRAEFRNGEIEKVDLERRVVKRKGEEIKLTRAEFNLLAFFLQNPDRALSRDVILNSVWGYESFPNTRTVDAHVVHLRQKLEPEPESPRYFVTLHGVGYRFIP